MYSRCSFGTLCINLRCSSGAVFVQFGAVLVQLWCSFGAVSVQFWCRLVHKYLNTCTQGPISTQVSKYKNTITTNHTTDNKPWKFVNEKCKSSSTSIKQGINDTSGLEQHTKKTHHRKVTEALALSIQLFMYVMFFIVSQM